jgi:hypothetical protein
MSDGSPPSVGQPTSYPLTLRGASGVTRTFTAFPWGTPFKSVGAVYAVLSREVSDQHVVLYVGETGDLSTRFENHHKQACFDRNRKTHVGVLVESSVQRRLEIEADLVAAYRPVCNE